MPDETLHDVMVRVGLVRPRPRPLPTTMRAAWETAPEATEYLRMPRETVNDPNTLPYERRTLPEERAMNQELAQLADRQSLGGSSGYADGREAREFGQGLLEATGIPSWARGIEDLQYNNPGDALGEFAMGGLQTGSLLALPLDAAIAGRVPRAPMGYRPPLRLPPQIATEAPRLPPLAAEAPRLPQVSPDAEAFRAWRRAQEPGPYDDWLEMRREQRPQMLEMQRSMDEENPLFAAAGQEQARGATMEEVLNATTPDGAELLRGRQTAYLRGIPEEAPLLGTPDIAADPMAMPRRPGFGSRPPQRQGPNEDRYLFGRLPRQSEAASMRPQQAPDAGPVLGGRLPDGYRIDERGNMAYTRPEGPPSRRYHGTTSDVDEFAPGSHFGTAEAANRRLADNAPNADGARVYGVDAPQGNYVRVSDAGDGWNRPDYWLEMARNRSPRNDAEASLFNAIRRDQDLRGLRDEALYARIDQHFRDNGFAGAIYANRWEGGESVFLPGRLPRTAPDGGPVQAGRASLDDLRTQGFDVDTPLYRGSTADEVTLEARESGHKPVGPAIHLSPRADVASDYASREGGNVTRYYVRGRLATMDQWNEAMAAQPGWNVKVRGWDGYDEHVAASRIAAQRALQARGFTGVRGQIAGLGYGADEVAIFNPADIVLANAPRTGPNAGPPSKSNKPPSLPRRTPPRPKPPQRPMR